MTADPSRASDAPREPRPALPASAPRPPDRLVADELCPIGGATDGTAGTAPPVGPPPARPPERPVDGARAVGDFAALAETIRRAAPRLGPVRLVAIDGRAGSGKSTFAGRLRDALTAAGTAVAVLCTDDLLQGWLDTVTFWPRLEEWVLAPLRRGAAARYRRFDWIAGRFPPDWQQLGRPDVLILEGVSVARAVIRPELTMSVYLQVGRDERFARGVRRDGGDVIGDWSRWMIDEDAHFHADGTARHVDLLIDGDPVGSHTTETHYVQILPDATAGRESP